MADANVSGKPIISAMSIEAQAIVSLLRATKPGDIVTYKEMSSVTGRDVQKHRGAMQTAKNRVLRDDRMVFEAITNVGLKHLNAAESASTMPAYVKRIRGTARRGLRRAGTVDLTQVPADQRAAFVAAGSLLNIVDQVGAPREQRKLETSIEKQSATQFLPLQKALAALKED